MTKRPLPTIGVDKYTFFAVTEDTEGAVTYGEAHSLPGTVEIVPTDAGGSDVFDADNGAYDICTYIEKMGHDITNADIPPEVDALWRGLETKNGVVEVGNEAKTVYFGVAWRILKSDGTYRYVRYYKGAYSFASNVGGKTKPSSGAPERQTAKATYTALQRISDGKYFSYIDTDMLPEGTTTEQFEEKWFSDMSYYPVTANTQDPTGTDTEGTDEEANEL